MTEKTIQTFYLSSFFFLINKRFFDNGDYMDARACLYDFNPGD